MDKNTLLVTFYIMQIVFRRRQQGTEWRNLRSLGQKDMRRQRNSPVPRYSFLGAMQICIARTSYCNVAGWLGVCLSQAVLYQND